MASSYKNYVENFNFFEYYNDYSRTQNFICDSNYYWENISLWFVWILGTLRRVETEL